MIVKAVKSEIKATKNMLTAKIKEVNNARIRASSNEIK